MNDNKTEVDGATMTTRQYEALKQFIRAIYYSADRWDDTRIAGALLQWEWPTLARDLLAMDETAFSLYLKEDKSGDER